MKKLTVALPRIADDQQLEELKADDELFLLEEAETLRIEHGLDPSRRYCRPWTRDFVEDLAAPTMTASTNNPVELRRPNCEGSEKADSSQPQCCTCGR